MTAFDDRQRGAVLDDRANVAATVRHLGQGGEDVQPGERARRRHEVLGARRHLAAHLLEQLVLEPAAPLVGAERFRLVLFELRGHVALGAGERLATHVLGGHA